MVGNQKNSEPCKQKKILKKKFSVIFIIFEQQFFFFLFLKKEKERKGNSGLSERSCFLIFDSPGVASHGLFLIYIDTFKFFIFHLEVIMFDT